VLLCFISPGTLPWTLFCFQQRLIVSRSEPDSKQKTETELTFWYVFPYFVHSEPFQSKQQQKQLCTANSIWGDNFESSKLKARTSLLPYFNEKRRSSFELRALKKHSKMSPQVGLAVPVTIESVTICDICDQNVTKPVSLKKPKKKQRYKFGHISSLWQLVTVKNVTNWSHIRCDWYSQSHLGWHSIRDCARGYNNRGHTRPQLSAIAVTRKAFFERLYLVLGLSPFEPRVNCPYV